MVLMGTAFALIIFLVATLLLSVSAAESTIDIELTEVTRMYGDIMADFLINSPNWYSIDKLDYINEEEPIFSTYTLGYNCKYRYDQAGGITDRSGWIDGPHNTQCNEETSIHALYGVGTLEGANRCDVVYSSAYWGYYQCINNIPFTKDFYLHSDCGCLAWKETVDGETIVHTGIVDWSSAEKNEANCENHPLPFCIDSAGYYWNATVTNGEGETKSFGWNSELVGEPDVIIKRVVGIYDDGKIGPGKLEFRITASEPRRTITLVS